MKIPIIPSLTENLNLFLSICESLCHRVNITTVPTSAMATPEYKRECGGEKKVSGLFSK